MTESILGERVNQNLSNWIFPNKNHLLYLGIYFCVLYFKMINCAFAVRYCTVLTIHSVRSWSEGFKN
jgi:hypothetical protein